MSFWGRSPLVLAVVVVVFCSGCLVRSVQPWLKADAFTFEEDLLGGWIGKGEQGDVAMTFVAGPDNSYEVQYSEKDNHGVFLGRLAKFGSEYYLDFRPKEKAPGVDGLLLFPSHSVARLEISSDNLTVRPLDYEAVKAAAKLDRLRDLRYAWDESGELIFISTTEELQRFLLGLGRTSNLYAPPIHLVRKR